MRMHHTPCGMLAMVCALACIATAAREAGAQVSANERQGAPHIPSPPPPHLLLSEGRTLYEAGRYKEAAASFERALQLGIAKPHEAAWEVARSYEKLGNDKQARRWRQIAVQLADASSRPGHEAARALPSSLPAPPALACATHPAEAVQWRMRPRRTPTEKSRSRRSWTTSTI